MFIWELLHLASCLSNLYTRCKAWPDSQLREHGKSLQFVKHLKCARLSGGVQTKLSTCVPISGFVQCLRTLYIRRQGSSTNFIKRISFSGWQTNWKQKNEQKHKQIVLMRWMQLFCLHQLVNARKHIENHSLVQQDGSGFSIWRSSKLKTPARTLM